MSRVISLPALTPLENFFHFTTTTMVPREFSKAFGFDNQHTHDEEVIASPPPTITRRSGKIPRSPVPQPIEP